MAKLECGVNWFSGGIDKDQVIANPQLTQTAFILAQALAFSQVMKEMMDYYKLPCPQGADDNCANKFGEYGLQVILSTEEVRNAAGKVIKVKAHCRVNWFLKIWCSRKIVAVPGPIAGDYEKLRKEYLRKR